MSPGFRVGAFVTPEIVRDFNLGEWRKGSEYYFGHNPRWRRPEHEILRGIEHPTFDVAAILRAVPVYPATDEGVRAAWANHMALHAGCHAWPNANHRTAMLTFNFALAAAQSQAVGFTRAERGEDLVHQSHAQRDADGGEYTLEELQDASHPYRRLFAGFTKELTIVGARDAGKLAKFGPRPE